MIRKTVLAVSILPLAACATPLELAKEEGWVILSGEEVIALHQGGLLIEGPNWTVTYSPDGTKFVNSTQASKTLAWEIRDGKFCQELYRTDAWDCGDISIIARKDDQIRYFNHSGAIRDEGTIVDGG